ncbi:hypothetical protein CYLTODRAFT_458027 [Cylindrobasidium torrendii FP15055 ss-10]|uniref:UBX domain-containing protein n=1 Tax=Cylindrobasidium torrendii FP15055 ss-10 TaxID=1314674 RepID=A0A0D7AZ89_9AGAR|nr:hypothetical protein CYLTODRAFT_458027 [Cylindrobasidium torrendii FP15055 ss-10]
MSDLSTSPQPAAASSATTASPAPSDYKVFKAPVSVEPVARPDLPDEWFQPNALELRIQQSMLSSKTQALNNAPLKFKSARDAEEQAKLDRFPNTTIRVRFPDMTQVQKIFPSNSKIRVVYAFVRELLKEEVKSVKFILYQPPKYDLKVSDPAVRDKTLGQLKLAPSSVLLLRFIDADLKPVDVPSPLLDSVIAQAEELPRPPEVETKPDTSGKPTPGRTLGSSSGSTSSGEKKVPKWLKLSSACDVCLYLSPLTSI